jgi:excisionase family DNA binding protein
MTEVILPQSNSKLGLSGIADLLSQSRDDSHGKPLAFLRGRHGQEIQLPDELFEVLQLVVQAMQSGQGVSIAPLNAKLTTQQAADMLEISRPTLIKLAEARSVPMEMIGRHRRLPLRNVLELKAQLMKEKEKAFAELTALNEKYDLYNKDRELLEALR